MAENYVQGDFGRLMRCILKLRAPKISQVEDIKIRGNDNVSLMNQSNQVVEQWTISDIYGQAHTNTDIFQNVLSPYLETLIMGYNLSFFTFGSSGSGKTTLLFGDRNQNGVVQLMMEQLFNQLRSGRVNYSSAERPTDLQSQVSMKFIEVVNERVADLLGSGQGVLSVTESPASGPFVEANALYPDDFNHFMQIFDEGMKKLRGRQTDYDENTQKSMIHLQIELKQQRFYSQRREYVYLVSRLNFFDLPPSDILKEDPESIRIRESATLNKGVLALSGVIRNLSRQNVDYIDYTQSALTHLMKDALGGNSYTIGLFCVKHGDIEGSQLTLETLKSCQNIITFPIINDGPSLGLLQKLRVESSTQLENRGKMHILGDNSYSGTGEGQLIEIEKKLIENNLEKLQIADQKNQLSTQVSSIREQYNNLLREKQDLRQELIRSEENKLEISKTLVELQIENTKLMEAIQNQKYDANTRLLNAESDILDLNIKEEKAISIIHELQEKLKDSLDTRAEFELELVAVKKNLLQANADLEAEQMKNGNLGVELISLANENKALHDDLNDIYKKSGSADAQNTRLLQKLEKLETENQEQREALVYTKAEIERLKTEMIKYDVMEQQYRLDLDNRKLDMERGYVELSKEKQDEMNRLKSESMTLERKIQDDKLFWESQRNEIMHKNKLAQRTIQDLKETNDEQERLIQEQRTEINNWKLQIEEMREVYRKKLIQYVSETMAASDRPSRLGYDTNFREELIRSYTEKEITLTELLEKEKRMTNELRGQLRGLKNYTKELKYLAEDLSPIGNPLPDILTREPPVQLDEGAAGKLSEEDATELRELRRKNQQAAEEIRHLQQQILDRSLQEPNIQQRLIDEIDYLRTSKAGAQNISQIETLREERNTLQEENRKLVAQVDF